MYDPVTESADVTQTPISPRIDSVEDARIGLFDNGKPAAEPLLRVVRERLEARYPDAEITTYAVDHLNLLRNDEELDRLESWADTETDVCIGAIGDCGSCTKFLVYGVDAIERSGTPAVGIIDSGFSLDWESNATDFGRQLRQYSIPEHAEVRDIETVRERISDDDIDGILAQLTTPRTAAERGEEA